MQSDKIPTDVDRDSSETEIDLPFKNDNGKTNFTIESSNDEEWQLIDLQ